ncbi:hypothetical protein B0O80DRAFT_423514 [Mortierella sp. GBAus27b]|nr:hypothetical protein BGX31_011502 [Mortierella sp. GBA43]KAI8359605.1 hypothetical protein B0O80DRAFT_423514 [Mortierella sp. GBAus27b]
MHLSPLQSLAFAAAFAVQALPQVLAADPFKPFGVGLASSAYTEGQSLYVSDGIRYTNNTFALAQQFASLNLSTSWTSDSPAWTNLTRVQSNVTSQGTAALPKGDILYFFSNTTINQYNTKTNQWSQGLNMTWTYNAFSGGAVTDTDTDLIYGIQAVEAGSGGGNQPTSWRFTELNIANKSYSYVDVNGRPNPALWTPMAYSSSAKAIFGYEDGAEVSNTTSSLLKYNITSKTWAQVNGTGDAPTTRSGACFVSSHGGQKLIVAGGRSVNGTETYSDVYIFDVASSAWSKLANAPRPAWGHVCAVSGDLLVYWGGVDTTKDNISSGNDQGPAILNIASNTWGTNFAPPGQGSNKPHSSANRALSNIGTVALTAISIAVSGWLVL